MVDVEGLGLVVEVRQAGLATRLASAWTVAVTLRPELVDVVEDTGEATSHLSVAGPFPTP